MKTYGLDAFCNMIYLSAPEFSPNGKRFCFVASRADREKNSYRSYIYEYDEGTGKARQLTSGGRERGFVFLDDDTLLFPGDREGDQKPGSGTKYYCLSLTGGEAVKAFTFPVNVEKLIPLPDGTYAAAGAVVPGFEDLYLGNPKRLGEYRKYVKENEDYEVVDQVPWWWNGSGFTGSEYTALYRFDPKKGRAEMLTGKNFTVSDAKLSPDGTEIWFFGSEVKPMLPMDLGIGLYRLRLADGKTEKIAENTEFFEMQDFRFADSFILILATDRSCGVNTDCDFYRMEYSDHSVSLYRKWGESIGSSVGSDVRYGGGHSLKVVGDTVYFISTLYDTAELYRLENGAISRVSTCGGSVDSFDVYGSSVRYVGLKDMRPQELYGSGDKRLTRFNAAVTAGKYTAQPEALNVTAGGHEIHGFVLKPAGYTAGKKYPVIYDIHGGPKTVYGPVFYHEMQYWAGLGYFVIFCNPTGSDGRGTFADIRGKYGTVDYEDLMAFCDAALAAYPDMDADELFETGGSYGGFMTNWIVGHTDRFRACVSQRSISDWLSFWGVSDIGVAFGRDQCAADPWSDPEKMWFHSPLKYADRCVTPTLFIHSFEDYRCPIDQGYQMFTALIAHGCEAKMVLFRGENHELSRSGKPAHRLRRLDEITKWFADHRK